MSRAAVLITTRKGRFRLRRRLHVVRNWLLDLYDADRLGPLGDVWLEQVNRRLDALDDAEVCRCYAG